MAEQIVTVTIVSNGPCGKTQFIKTWMTNVYRNVFSPTVFDDYHANMVVDGTPVSLLIWDTAGFDDMFVNLRPLFYSNTDAVLIAFSVDDEYSYESVRNVWLPEIKQHCPNIPWLLLGLKADLRFSSEQYIELRRRANMTKEAATARACIPEQAARDMAKELGQLYATYKYTIHFNGPMLYTYSRPDS
eukprot:Em0004g1228a